MLKTEQRIEKWVNENSLNFSLRFKRFLAIYFPNAIVRRKFWLETFVELGEGTFFNPNVFVVDDYQSKKVLLKVGSNCSIAPGVIFAPFSAHNNSKILREKGLLKTFEKKEKIVIGNDVWIGANCTIAAGVRIGDCCIIGANSYVNKDLPPYSLAYGVPVKIIKDVRS